MYLLRIVAVLSTITPITCMAEGSVSHPAYVIPVECKMVWSCLRRDDYGRCVWGWRQVCN